MPCNYNIIKGRIWTEVSFFPKVSKLFTFGLPCLRCIHGRNEASIFFCMYNSISKYSLIVDNFIKQGTPYGTMGKESTCKARAVGSMGLIPELERSPGGGNGNPLQYSFLGNPTDRGAWGLSVHGIHQARTLEWVAISFSNAWRWEVKVKSLSCVWLLATPWTAAYQAPPSMGFSGQQYWSGVPLPSPKDHLNQKKKIKKICPFLFSGKV